MYYILNWFTRSADKVYEVIDDMEHATIGKDPKVNILTYFKWSQIVDYILVSYFQIGFKIIDNFFTN